VLDGFTHRAVIISLSETPRIPAVLIAKAVRIDRG
jgi:hypothetical protein